MRVDPAWLADEPDLAGATRAQLTELAATARVVRLRPGDVLHDVGDVADHVYWVSHGYLNSVRTRGRATVGFGGHGMGNWGSRDALLGRRRLFRVWATDHTDVVAVPVEVYVALLRSSPELLEQQIRSYVVELRSTTEMATREIDLDLPRRLCRVLLDEFTRDGFVELPLRRDELARMLKVSRPELSTTVNRLVQRGLLAPAGSTTFAIPDRTALEHLARVPNAAGPTRPALPGGTPPAPDHRLPVGTFPPGLEPGLTTLRTVPPGTLVARRDDPVDEVHVVLDGALSMRAPTLAGGFRLTDARPGPAVLGAGGVVSGTGWPVEIVAVAETRLLSVPAPVAAPRLVHLDARWALLRHAARHLVETAATRANGAGTPPLTRLARLLAARTAPDGTVVTATAQTDLAAELGTSRQTVSSALARLRTAGVITGSTHTGLRVLDQDALRRLAGPGDDAAVSAT